MYLILTRIALNPFISISYLSATLVICASANIYLHIPIQVGKLVQVGKDQEKAQSEKDSHSKNRGGKKLNSQSGTYTLSMFLYFPGKKGDNILNMCPWLEMDCIAFSSCIK